MCVAVSPQTHIIIGGPLLNPYIIRMPYKCFMWANLIENWFLLSKKYDICVGCFLSVSIDHCIIVNFQK